MERRTYTVTEAATVLGISRTSAYERVRAGDLPALRLGRRIVIARHALENLLGSPLPEPSLHGVVGTTSHEAP
jgi:excisionase family DNA binding protein